jgi:transcriptional regulator with XRE-family HTH domain
VADVAVQLRAARERAGLGIEDVSARTRINPTFLQAIERGEFERLPGDFYTRAFLRTYARELDLSPDDVVRDYRAQQAEAQPQPVAPLPRTPARPAREHRDWQPGIPTPGMTVAPLLVVATLLMIVIAARNRPIHTGGIEEGAVGTSGVVQASMLPAPSRAVPAKSESEPEKLVVEIRPTAVTWVAATADGARMVYRLLQPGEHVTVEGRNALAFRIGNAAAFEYAVNGAPGKALGGPGEVRDFQITRENYRTYRR